MSSTSSESEMSTTSSESFGEPQKLAPGKRVRHPKKGKNKHVPCAPKKARFMWSDNNHLVRSPYRLNQPAPLKFRLIDEKGNAYRYGFIQRHNMDWTDKKWVSRANTWIDQLQDRTVNRCDGANAPPQARKRARNTQFTAAEQNWIELELRHIVQNQNRALQNNDWEYVARNYNREWAGRQLPAGSRYASTRKSSNQSKPLKTPRNAPTRTAENIRTHVNRWPRMLKSLNKLGADLTVGTQADDSTDSESSDDTDSEVYVFPEPDPPGDNQDPPPPGGKGGGFGEHHPILA